MSFNDHFSKQAEIYSQARPTYPDELFDYLSGLAPKHNLCWDCATGNGQAAVALASYFNKVIATDGSAQQIANARTKENVEYKVATAEESGLVSNSVDLITVATGAHWFDLDKFYAEAERVATAKGMLAIWTYSSATINEAIDELMEWFAYDLLLDYWPDGRWYVRNKYTTLPFPFQQIETPEFYCEKTWTKEQWLNYLRTWSSYNRFISQHTTDPINELLPKLDLLWNDKEFRKIRWPLHMKCARLNDK